MNGKNAIRTIAFVSGKGGVGQTSVVLNLAFLLSKLNKKTLVFDANYTTVETEELLGVHFTRCLHLNDDDCIDIDALITNSPGGVAVLPSDINQQRDCALTLKQQYGLINGISKLKSSFDYFLIDVPNCTDKSNFLLASATDEIVIIIDEEPVSHVQAYWTMQTFANKYGIEKFGVIVNRVRSKFSGSAIFAKLQTYCYESSLNAKVEFYGSSYKDNHVEEACKKHELVGEYFPQSNFTRSLTDVAVNMDSRGSVSRSKGTIEFFPVFGN